MRRNLWSGVALLMLLAACGGGSGSAVGSPPSPGAPGPALVVERFLQAANVNDLATMGELFGTADRTIVQLDGRKQAEERLFLLASLLHHDDFSIQSQRPVPGRSHEAVELSLRLSQPDGVVTVPFTVVRRSRGGWIIEKIDVVALTSG